MNPSHDSVHSNYALKVRMPEGIEHQFDLDKPEMKIGRTPDNDLVLDHSSISRRHARLVVMSGQVFLEDLGSSNGTFVGEKLLTPGALTPVAPDQVIKFGHVEARLHVSGTPVTAAEDVRVETEAAVSSLLIRMPDGAERKFPLDRPVTTVGRTPDNDLVLDHPGISRKHARIIAEADHILVEDLGSANGTFFGGERLAAGTPSVFQPGQVLKFGSVQVTLMAGKAAPVPAPEASSGEPAPAIVSKEPEIPPPQPSVPHQAAPARRGINVPFVARRTIPVVALGGVVVLLAGLCVGAIVVVNTLRAQRERTVDHCEQPVMQLFSQGGLIYQEQALQTAVPRGVANNPIPTPEPASLPASIASQEIRPIANLAFLELPFPYDGSNVNFGGSAEQFLLASQYNLGQGGRINSWFDHYLPLYPAPQDPGSPGGEEPAEPPIGKNILPYYGLLDPYLSYSGHPGLDFSTFEYRQPTTPIFAAADGVIYSVGKHGSSGALFVKIRHTVQGVGDFLTIYWHLHPDDWFQSMLGREGEPIQAGTRIGTMGNTGYSTGHHLHFEVRFDRDGNGEFPLGEAVDPYGWIPGEVYAADPWQQRALIVSNYLWIHPLGSVSQIPDSGGGQITLPAGTGGELPSPSVCVQPETLPPGGQVFYSWAPDPDPTSAEAGTGNGCVLSVLDANGKPVKNFNPPLQITIPFKNKDIQNVDPQTLTIYWQEAGGGAWKALETSVDLENNIASAETTKPGRCSLMGKPVKDIAPPVTEIEIAGERGLEDSYYDVVLASLKSKDASGVKETFYSLDNGSSWQLYSAPFEVQPSGIPAKVVMDEQFFGGLPGTVLILAYSVDKAGNVENPPAYYYFSIDPSKKPERGKTPTTTSTVTPTLTPTPTGKLPTATPTQTATPTVTEAPAVCSATVKLTKNANCRKGPSQIYDVYTSFVAGEELVVEGSNDELGALWWWVQIPNQAGHCWISDSAVEVSGTPECLPVIEAPPTPTPTATPTPEDVTPPPIPVPIYPTDGTAIYSCAIIELSWSAVTDPSGIARYEWVVEQYNVKMRIWESHSSGRTKATAVEVELPCNNKFRWMVRAVDGRGNVGSYSAWQNCVMYEYY